MARPIIRSGVVKCEWIGNCYGYQDSKGRIVYIKRQGNGWVSSWENPDSDSKGPFVLPSVGTYKTLNDAFLSSLSLYC